MADDAELREALFDFHEYLSDRIPPMMFAESLELLLRYPADLLASEIGGWVAQQQLSAPASDYLHHAVKKVWLMGDFDLAPRDVLGAYVESLGAAVLPYCPEVDRPILQENLGRLPSATGGPIAAKLDLLYRQEGSAAQTQDTATQPAQATQAAQTAPSAGARGVVVTQEMAAGLRRLSLFLERLNPQARGATAEYRGEVASQFVATAAAQATTAEELQQQLEPLRALGFETGTERVFRTLAESIPGWGRLAVPEGTSAPAPAPGQIHAMQRIVALAEDPAEAAKRFRELVHAAIEQFNEGHLGRAVTIFELAERLAAENVQKVYVDAVRQRGAEQLQTDRLRKLAERGDTRAELRKVMSFFVTLRPDALLEALDHEPRRDGRHELLALLEAHGPEARALAQARLRAALETPDSQVDPFFQRNLVYLLRVVPRPEDLDVEDEVNLVMRASGRSSPPPLVKQVIAYLSATRHEKAERALITYLHVFENMLLQPDSAAYEREEVEVLLDRTCAGLVRYGSQRAWRALVEHGLKPEARLGSTMSRLAEAGRQDLSASPDVVDRLLGALASELHPPGRLSLVMRRKDERILCLIQALSGTQAESVHTALQAIVDGFPGQSIAEAASKALAAIAAAQKPPETSLSGDLELFGLPALLQTLSQSRVTGVLNLMTAQGRPEASLVLEQGQMRAAQHGKIRGEEALYQLLERPFHGTFAFLGKRELPSSVPLAPPQDVLSLVLEGTRRHDEWKRAAALVPDHVTLKPTGTPQSPLGDEDEDFVHLVWAKATSGTGRPTDCEAAISTDAYRVRRLLAHWVEEGALAAA